MKTHEETTDMARTLVAAIPSDPARLRPLPPKRNRRRL